MDALIHDLKYGARMLAKAPALTLVAVLTIALGVGLTTHTFSVVYGAMLRGLDFDRGTMLVELAEENVSEGVRGNSVPLLDVLDWREQQTSFRGIAGYTQGTVNIADEGSPPERYDGGYVTANLFEQVDGVPILGRVFNPEEDAGLGEQVVILSYDVWQNRYGGDPQIIGRSVRANGVRATVVGVMPDGFHFPFNEDVWLPLGIDPQQAERGSSRVAAVARLLPGVTVEQADVQMDQIAARIAEAYPETNENVSVWTVSFTESTMPESIVAVLWVMLIAVFGVLLIACFNVANLLLARAVVRSKEMAVRTALGAERHRIVRQLLLESALIAAVGGAVGIVLAYVGIEAFNASIVDVERPYWIDIRLDVPALVFTIVITAFASLAAGALPAMRASGTKVHDILKDESRGTSSQRLGRFSSALVLGEIALSCALLVAAGMMVKSVINLQRLDLGFEGERVFTARLGLFDADYPDDEARRRFFDVLVEGFRADPEVEAAALATDLPANGAGTFRVAIEGVTYADDRDRPETFVTNVSEGYFDVLAVPILQGREIGLQDVEGAVDVAVVNESFARTHYGLESPLGRRIQLGADGAWLSIVGVVGDVYVGSNGPIGTSDRTEQVFRPIAQTENQRFVNVVARTRGDPGAFAASAQAIVASIDASLPLYWMRTMEESVEAATFIFGIFGSLFTTFGVAALFLAAVGLYGVMAFSVSRRTQEMGVRMAMGAEPRNVLTLVLAQGMKQLVAGGLVGLALGAALVQPMTVVFFDVRPSDPTVYAAIVVTLGVSGLLACIVPARRATRVSPVRALTGG
jgi:predicted permease